MGCINTQTRPVAMGRQNDMLRVERLQQHIITGPCSSSPGCHKVAYCKAKYDFLSNISYCQWLTKFVTFISVDLLFRTYILNALLFYSDTKYPWNICNWTHNKHQSQIKKTWLPTNCVSLIYTIFIYL